MRKKRRDQEKRKPLEMKIQGITNSHVTASRQRRILKINSFGSWRQAVTGSLFYI
jgi:hypothetical protein